MANPITYGDLDRFLGATGLIVERRDAAAVVYALPTTDIFFAFPPREPSRSVDPFHLWSVRKMLVERGIVEERDFERWECGIRSGESRNPRPPAVATTNEARGRQ